MSKRFPQVTYRDAVRVARKLGFSFYRSGKGDHEIWRRGVDGRYTTIPNWGSKNLKRKTIKNILEDFKVTPDEFSKLKHGKK